MKHFKESIQITIAVNSIAESLLEQMAPDFKHRELVVETLIGRALASDRNSLSMLYNSLNGFKRTVNFEVGDNIVINAGHMNAYSYIFEEGKFVQKYLPIEYGVVKEIHPYADQSLLIEYISLNKQGEDVLNTTSIDHTFCDKIMLPEVCLAD